MDRSISKLAQTELIGAVGQRYRRATKRKKTRILDEFVELTKSHRKHAIRLLAQGEEVLSRLASPEVPSSNRNQRLENSPRWDANDTESK